MKVHTRSGITALETAIILVAFVIAASALAFVVLNLGQFTVQRTQEATTRGLQQAATALELSGSVHAIGDIAGGNFTIEQIMVVVKLAPAAEPFDITRLSARVMTREAVFNATVTPKELKGDGDNLIEQGETFRLVLSNFSLVAGPVNSTLTLTPGSWLKIEIIPPVGGILTIERMVPLSIPESATDIAVDLG